VDAPYARFLEDCHNGPADVDAWIERWSLSLSRHVDFPQGFAVAGAIPRTFSLRFVSLIGGAWSAFSGAKRFMDAHPEGYEVAYRRPFRLAHASRTIGQRAASGVAPGFNDVLGVGISFDHREKYVLSAPSKTPLPHRSPAVYRVQRHLAGAAAQRLGWSEASATVVSPEEGLIHAEHPETLGVDRTVLERIARIEFNRDEADPKAQELWDALWRGGYAVTSMVETSGRRYVVLRRMEGERPPLTPAERAVLWCAADALTIKETAARLGLTLSTVSAHLARGLEKLGLRHRSELIGWLTSRGGDRV
jgi:DNA-binding CsgD family transcriptional regulator